MTLRSLRLFFAIGVLLCFVVSCSKSTPMPPTLTTDAESPDSTSKSPLVPRALESPVQTAEPSASGELLVRDPTPEAGFGTVQGILTLNKAPAAGRVLYLAKVIHTTDKGEGIGGVAALDPTSDPATESDPSGYFVFPNVSPGRYALGINSPIGPVLINRDGNEIFAEVTAGEITDIGQVGIIPFN